MFKLLIDTSVWLDLAKDSKQSPVLEVVEEMVRSNLLTLIVPRVLLEEFRRNRQRVANDSSKSLSTHFRLVKDAIGRVGGDGRKTRVVLSHLDDVSQKIPIVGGAAVDVLDRVDELLSASHPFEPSDAVKLRAAQRAIDKKAPFHRDKNSMADALLIEAYAECVQGTNTSGVRFAFVTHNKNDFSSADGNQKRPHSDYASIFSRVKSLYFISLPEALGRIEPALVSDVMLEASWSQEPRGLTEMLKAQDLLFHQVWYKRHQSLRYRVERGTTKVVERETFPAKDYSKRPIQSEVWMSAQRAARRVEKKYGKENLGPWDDFEWGMINGKLSALRWVLGDEWDMLDT